MKRYIRNAEEISIEDKLADLAQRLRSLGRRRGLRDGRAPEKSDNRLSQGFPTAFADGSRAKIH